MKRLFSVCLILLSALTIILSTASLTIPSFNISSIPSSPLAAQGQPGFLNNSTGTARAIPSIATLSPFPSLNPLFDLVDSSVVQITTSLPPPNVLDPTVENRTALGSGFVYDNEGHIVTNNHVVANARIVDVTLLDGSRYTANVSGRDPNSD